MNEENSMKVVYLNIPALADKRHIIIDGRRIVNTAAPASGLIYMFDNGRSCPQIEEPVQEKKKVKAPL